MIKPGHPLYLPLLSALYVTLVGFLLYRLGGSFVYGIFRKDPQVPYTLLDQDHLVIPGLIPTLFLILFLCGFWLLPRFLDTPQHNLARALFGGGMITAAVLYLFAGYRLLRSPEDFEQFRLVALPIYSLSLVLAWAIPGSLAAGLFYLFMRRHLPESQALITTAGKDKTACGLFAAVLALLFFPLFADGPGYFLLFACCCFLSGYSILARFHSRHDFRPFAVFAGGLLSTLAAGMLFATALALHSLFYAGIKQTLPSWESFYSIPFVLQLALPLGPVVGLLCLPFVYYRYRRHRSQLAKTE
ncbi:hypothetical protein O4H49_03225 [Kiloniella laminariae]|uniref:Uncharacterized protein n=1 Tax=Kiloniella laminariae TaxID=454162 RepID=A0ABT4LF94_9PROT|nr:hypothetical protein [Kiloniella laminariae]MCZ4279775.1 hypothetical protein [Kiloniella laminariae]